MHDIEAAAKEFEILDHAPVGMFVIRRDYVALFWNRCLEDWTELSRAEVIGRNICTFHPHLKEIKFHSRIESVFEGGPPILFSSQLHRHIIPIRMKDGKLRIQRTTVTSLPSSNGPDCYALFAIEDVTELSRLIEDCRRAKEEVKTLSGLLPICAYCKNIRDDRGYWLKLESYISERSSAEFSHGICPDCMQKYYPEIAPNTPHAP